MRLVVSFPYFLQRVAKSNSFARIPRDSPKRMIKKTKVFIVLSVILVITGSWGFLVHKTVHQLAVYELPKGMLPFFYDNLDLLVTHATRPDIRRKQDSSEAAKHFIDLEMYGERAAVNMPKSWEKAVSRYRKDSLLKYGYVPYQVVYSKAKLTEAFRAGNKDSILFYATDLGHYIADSHVPLHTTVNYDGQFTNQKGLHSVWESMIPELEIGTYNLYSKHKAMYLKDPASAIWLAIRKSASLVPDMLLKEKEVSKDFTDDKKFRIQVRRGHETKSYTTEFVKAYAAALGSSVNDQLRSSADLIADFWYTSWVDAGRPDLSRLCPDWTATTKEKLDNDLKAFRGNKLIENGVLLSGKRNILQGE